MSILDFIFGVLALIVILITIVGYLGMKFNIKQEENTIKKLEKENITLRNQLRRKK